MKFMMQMNVKGGSYQMAGWSKQDVKAMVDFMNSFNAELKSKGQWVTGEGLVSPDQTRIVHAGDDGRPVVTDGPFAESKEFIAGFWIVEVKNADEAHALAAKVSLCPGPGGKLVTNPNKSWSDIDKALPGTKIEVLGPPPTSGTRDALHELLLEPGAEKVPALAELKKSDAKAFEKAWKS